MRKGDLPPGRWKSVEYDQGPLMRIGCIGGPWGGKTVLSDK